MKKTGYATLTTDGGTQEYDTVTCAHGNEIITLRPGADPGGFCRMCMKPICEKCVATGRCEPFEKKLEAMERRDRLRRAVG